MRLVVDARDQDLPAEASVRRLAELLADRANRLWLDVSDPGPEDVARLRREFGFHELALEDVTRPHERPRCDAYAGYYFAVEDRVRERIDAIEEAIVTGADGAARDLFRLRKELLRVPRLLAPTSHVLAEAIVAFLACMVAWGFIHSRRLGWL